MKISLKLKLFLGFCTIAAIALSAGVAGIHFTGRVGEVGGYVGHELAAQADAAMKIKVSILETRESLAGFIDIGGDGDKAPILAKADAALWYARAVLEGGTNGTVTLTATRDPAVAESMQTVLGLLNTFKGNVENRIKALYGGARKEARIAERELGETSAALTAEAETVSALTAAKMRQGLADLEASNRQARLWLVACCVAGVLVSLLLAWVISNTITSGVFKATELAQSMAKGDLTGYVEVRSRDEVGALATALNHMSESLRAMFGQVAECAGSISTRAGELSAVSAVMRESAGAVSGKATSVAGSTAQLNGNMTSVAAAMEQVSAHMHGMATATEQMSASISGIAESTATARTIAEEAVTCAQEVTSEMSDLGEAAQKVGNVIQTIADISDRTKLLALNATIEAARAGAAGRGFTVVASEIKNLARKTTDATEDITRRIGGMQATTRKTVVASERVRECIDRINATVLANASAVEEQSVTAREISASVAQTSTAVSETTQRVSESSAATAAIATDIRSVDLSSSHLNEQCNEVESSSGELAQLADQLRAAVGRFKV
ncbi:MAG: methyl-accepting chemotaxis protein [Deferrisomatales bacterium]|nr:methyl-accepting chemotaxis protein [Deferrisomatales bacterium]